MADNLDILQSVITETISFKCHIDPSFYKLSYCLFVVMFNFNLIFKFKNSTIFISSFLRFLFCPDGSNPLPIP